MTALYVAPHPDDVALSCAGGVLARVGAGERVVVCTVFTRGGGRARERARAEEDAEALRRAGAEGVHLGLEDGLWREGRAARFASLALGAPPRPGVVREVGGALAEVVRRVRPREVWLPLGVGGHVDHLAVFLSHPAVSRALARAHAGPGALRFYEERPYAFVPALRALRRRELCGGAPGRVPSPAAILRQLSAGGCGELLGPEEAEGCAAELARRLAEVRRGTGVRLWSRRQRFGRPALGAAAGFIGGYASQVRWLFGRARLEALWPRLAPAPGGGWFEREVRLTGA